MRAQHGGRDAYVGIYDWNSGKQELMLFRRSGQSWTQLGSYSSGPLAAGTTLKLVAVGDTISFLENGFPCLTASDRSLSGGAPGIMIFGAGAAGDWSGGDASGPIGFHVRYMSTDADGVRSYQVSSPDDGPAPGDAGANTHDPPRGCRTTSCTHSRFSPDWVMPSVAGWRRCAGSMRRTSTT